MDRKNESETPDDLNTKEAFIKGLERKAKKFEDTQKMNQKEYGKIREAMVKEIYAKWEGGVLKHNPSEFLKLLEDDVVLPELIINNEKVIEALQNKMDVILELKRRGKLGKMWVVLFLAAFGFSTNIAESQTQ